MFSVPRRKRQPREGQVKNLLKEEKLIICYKLENYTDWHPLFSQSPGYSAEMKRESLAAYEFPNGSEWQKLINEGLFTID